MVIESIPKVVGFIYGLLAFIALVGL